MFFQPTFFSVLNENEDTETEEGQLEKTLWIFLEVEPDKILMMTTQEEVGEKMNSSSKTMVQAVTLLTALRMFANGKMMVMMKMMIIMVVDDGGDDEEGEQDDGASRHPAHRSSHVCEW